MNGGALTERFDVGSSPAPTWHIVLGLSPSVVSDSATPWTVARQAPLSMGFSRQEYWSGFPCSSPGGPPDPEITPMSLKPPALQADSLPAKLPGNDTPTYMLKEFREGREPRGVISEGSSEQVGFEC